MNMEKEPHKSFLSLANEPGKQESRNKVLDNKYSILANTHPNTHTSPRPLSWEFPQLQSSKVKLEMWDYHFASSNEFLLPLSIGKISKEAQWRVRTFTFAQK